LIYYPQIKINHRIHGYFDSMQVSFYSWRRKNIAVRRNSLHTAAFYVWLYLWIYALFWHQLFFKIWKEYMSLLFGGEEISLSPFDMIVFKRLLLLTVCTEIGTPPKSTKSRDSNSLVSRGTNPDWDLGLIWTCTEKFECLD